MAFELIESTPIKTAPERFQGLFLLLYNFCFACKAGNYLVVITLLKASTFTRGIEVPSDLFSSSIIRLAIIA